MDTNNQPIVKQQLFEEHAPKTHSGMAFLLLDIVLMVTGILAFVLGCVQLEVGGREVLGAVMMILGGLAAFIVAPILILGFRIIKPNEAMVLTLFGKYTGTLKGEGFYFVNPFSAGVSVPVPGRSGTQMEVESGSATGKISGETTTRVLRPSRKISLKAMTLNNDRQKINDQLGNPIEIGVVVIWRVTNTVKALFNVDNYYDFLSIQCDSALRNIVRLYPYDAKDDDSSNEKSLRGSSVEIAARLREELQEKVGIAGIEVMEARITHLAYAPEIAAAMLQRQQASAVVDARQLIVEGAVGMVEMALERLNEKNVVELDEERKAAMVSNLLVVLCGSKDAQPVVNSGSIY